MLGSARPTSPTQSHEMLLDAHARAFRVFGGVPKRGIYDNMKTAVAKVGVGKRRILNTRFAAMAAHYLFEPDFCNVAVGWEKGVVEKNVQDSRPRVWQDAAHQRFSSFAELNVWLGARCQSLWLALPYPDIEHLTIADALTIERDALIPMVPVFDGYVEAVATVSSTRLVSRTLALCICFMGLFSGGLVRSGVRWPRLTCGPSLAGHLVAQLAYAFAHLAQRAIRAHRSRLCFGQRGIGFGLLGQLARQRVVLVGIGQVGTRDLVARRGQLGGRLGRGRGIGACHRRAANGQLLGRWRRAGTPRQQRQAGKHPRRGPERVPGLAGNLIHCDSVSIWLRGRRLGERPAPR